MGKEEVDGLIRNRDDAISMVLDDAMRLGGALGAFLKCGPYNQTAVTCAFNAAQVVYCREIVKLVSDCEDALRDQTNVGG